MSSPPPPPPPPPPPSPSPSPFDDQSGGFPPPPVVAPQYGQQPPPGYVAYQPHSSALGDQRLASAGRRIVARILDGLIVGVPVFLVALFLSVDNTFGLAPTSTNDAVLFGLFVLAATTAYNAAFLATKGATPAKMALSVKVVYEDGRRLDLQGALMRLLTDIVFGVLSLVGVLATLAGFANFGVVLVSLIFLFSDDRRRTVWDRIAKTIVIAT